MNKSIALSAAAALTFTVAGGVSALALTMQRDDSAPATSAQPAVVIEYVDQFGNPVAPPTLSGATGSQLPVTVEPQEVLTALPTIGAASYPAAENYEPEHEEAEHREDEDHGYDEYEEYDDD